MLCYPDSWQLSAWLRGGEVKGECVLVPTFIDAINGMLFPHANIFCVLYNDCNLKLFLFLLKLFSGNLYFEFWRNVLCMNRNF